jgi:hypothetical protein
MVLDAFVYPSQKKTIELKRGFWTNFNDELYTKIRDEKFKTK